MRAELAFLSHVRDYAAASERRSVFVFGFQVVRERSGYTPTRTKVAFSLGA